MQTEIGKAIQQILMLLADIEKIMVVNAEGQASVPPVRPLIFDGIATNLDLGRVQSFQDNNLRA